MHWDIELRSGSWLSMIVRARELDLWGACLELPGGASAGERYELVITPGARSVVMPAVVRWVGRVDGSGMALVCVSWLADPATLARLSALLRAAR